MLLFHELSSLLLLMIIMFGSHPFDKLDDYPHRVSSFGTMFNCRLFLLTCLFFNKSIQLTFANQSASKQTEVTYHINESTEFQAVNCYLTSVESPTPTNSASAVADQLRDAISAFEAYDERLFDPEDQTKYELDAKFKCLVDTDIRTTLAIMKNLVQVSENCNQETLDFLARVVEHQTFQGQVLNKYAKSRLEDCWIFNLNGLAQRFERISGKMDTSLFDLLEDVANRILNLRERAKRARGNIVISDQEPSKDRGSVLKMLKTVNFNRDQLSEIAVALHCIFEDSLQVGADERKIKLDKKVELARLESFYQKSLIDLCLEVEERALRALWFLSTYMKYAPKGASALLNSKRKTDPNLDYQLEIYRICKNTKANKVAIWNNLSKA